MRIAIKAIQLHDKSVRQIYRRNMWLGDSAVILVHGVNHDTGFTAEGTRTRNSELGRDPAGSDKKRSPQEPETSRNWRWRRNQAAREVEKEAMQETKNGEKCQRVDAKNSGTPKIRVLPSPT